MIDVVLKVSQALLTPLIASIALYVAVQQWKTNHRKLQLDLYDRRLEIYKRVRETIAHINTHASIDAQQTVELVRNVSEAQFLFGDDVADYLQTLTDKCIELSTASAGARGDFGDEDRQGHVARKWEAVKWIIAQPPQLTTVFKKYLQFPT